MKMNTPTSRLPRSSSPTPAVGGFSLIELMIVVLVLAVLMGIAYPSYEAHVVKTRRAAAAACAMEGAQFMERFYTTNLRYNTDRAGNAVALPASQCAAELATHYTIQLAAGTSPTTYSIQAAPVSGSRQAAKDTKCGTLAINQAGAKSVSNTSTDPDDCW